MLVSFDPEIRPEPDIKLKRISGSDTSGLWRRRKSSLLRTSSKFYADRDTLHFRNIFRLYTGAEKTGAQRPARPEKCFVPYDYCRLSFCTRQLPISAT
jgi:hypothetical protein